jgi:phage terminase Nu1 subunit (DNA packaging protein)
VNLHAYIKYLKDLARLDDASESEYQRLRNMRMRHEAEMAALKLREIKGQVLKTSDVEFIMTNLITATKNHLLSIPSRVTRLLIGVTSFQVIFDLLQNEIEVALRELSQWRVGQFAAQRAAFLASQGANIADFPEPHTNGEVSDETTDDEASTDT